MLEKSVGSVLNEASNDVELLVKVEEPAVATKALNDLAAAGIALVTFSLSQPSLDEVFLAITEEEEI